MGSSVIVRGLTHSYGGRQVLRGIDFSVGRGELFAVLGPNGGGKTTLFRLLSTLLPLAGEGEAEIEGADLRADPGGVRRRIGVVFQSPSLDGRLTVGENLRHQGHLYGLKGAELSRRIASFLERLGLEERRDERAETLSGGLRRRLEIAKGLLHLPRLLLMDEPSSGLDPGARRELRATLEELREREGITVLLTTHILEEADGADRVAILHRGELVACGGPDRLKSEIPGEVISLETEDPAALAERIRARVGGRVAAVDGTVRIEHEAAPRVLAELFEAFPREIGAVTLRRPTLEDVFVRKTGDRFPGGEGA